MDQKVTSILNRKALLKKVHEAIDSCKGRWTEEADLEKVCVRY